MAQRAYKQPEEAPETKRPLRTPEEIAKNRAFLARLHKVSAECDAGKGTKLTGLSPKERDELLFGS